MSTVTRSTRAAVDVEEIQTTKSEKLLAVVLAIFLLIGAIWTYQKLDNWVAETVAPVHVELSPADQAAIARSTAANQRFADAQTAALAAQSNLELKREAYRTALDAGQPAQGLELEYEAAQEELARAQDEANAAQAEIAAARPAAEAAYQRQQQMLQTKTDRHELVAFLLRLGLVVGLLGFGYWLMGRLRRRQSRYFPVALAVAGSAGSPSSWQPTTSRITSTRSRSARSCLRSSVSGSPLRPSPPCSATSRAESRFAACGSTNARFAATPSVRTTTAKGADAR
jgi:hypothetical protein